MGASIPVAVMTHSMHILALSEVVRGIGAPRTEAVAWRRLVMLEMVNGKFRLISKLF